VHNGLQSALTPTLTLYSGLSSGLYYSSHYKNLD